MKRLTGTRARPPLIILTSLIRVPRPRRRQFASARRRPTRPRQTARRARDRHDGALRERHAEGLAYRYHAQRGGADRPVPEERGGVLRRGGRDRFLLERSHG